MVSKTKEKIIKLLIMYIGLGTVSHIGIGFNE
jgi:hypothetical protein